jgi:2-methylcitrate dehydratase PrpD
MTAMEVIMDATYLFAKNFKTVTYEDIPAKVVEITKMEVLDTLAVAIAGFGQPGPKELFEMVQAWGGSEESTVIGSRQKVPAPNAAQVNATMVHSRDYDDVHEAAVMHPGVVTIPTALAMGELRGGLSGREMITAVACGVDMICRLGLATRPGVSPIKTGWHFTTLYGGPTAALTAGRVLGLDEETMVSAFGIAYHQCAGNGQCVIDGALTKRMGPGFSVRAGVTAALLAQKGVTGAKNCLEGEAGLYKVYHRGEYDLHTLTHDLGKHFEGINVSIKPYPCCRGTHPSIDAALAVAQKYNIKPENVEAITTSTGEANNSLLCTPFEQKVRPRNPVDTQFSIPWGVATALARRRVAMEDFTEAAIRDRAVLDLTGKLKAVVDPGLNSPLGIEPARVTVTMKDGAVYSEQVQHPLGSPERPMSFQDCVRKFEDCVSFSGNRLTQQQVKEVIDLVGELENLKDVRQIIGLLT